MAPDKVRIPRFSPYALSICTRRQKARGLAVRPLGPPVFPHHTPQAMRFLLSIFCLGALTLSGCAEGLTGPEAVTSAPSYRAIDSPGALEAPDAPNLYTTWFGSDEYGIFQLSFYPNETKSNRVFYGTGVCRFGPTFPEPNTTDCHVSAGMVQGGTITFEIETLHHGVIAKVEASPDSEYTSLYAKLFYEDGTQSSIEFVREAPRPAAELE